MKLNSKLTIRFVTNGERVQIDVKYQNTRNAPKAELSICGTCDGHSGQCQDTIREAGGDDADVTRLCDIWDRWHLNGMKAGTPAQEDYLRTLDYEHTKDGEHLGWARRHLAAAGLEPDKGYSYGSHWLYEPVPAAVLEELDSILDRLNGAHIGEVPDVSDAPDISESDDLIDSRDFIKRLEIYESAVRALGLDPHAHADSIDFESDFPDNDEAREIWEEFKALQEFEAQASGYAGDWNHGEPLIRDSHWQTYAEQFAEDIGAVNSDERWPNNHIDWEAAARELQSDYSAVEFKGVTYWMR